MKEKQALILRSIYKHRAVSKEQFVSYLNIKEEELAEMVQSKQIVEQQKNETTYYCLTTRGVNQLREIDRMKYRRSGENKEGYVLASKLYVSEKLALHQLGVTEFDLQLRHRNKQLETSCDFEFLDGGVVGENIRAHLYPDAWFRCGETEIFLEVDRGTESRNVLKAKAERYQKLNHWIKKQKKERRILILFCCLGDQGEHRKSSIMNCFVETLIDEINESFDFVLGTLEECLSFVEQEILPSITPASIESSPSRFMEQTQEKFERRQRRVETYLVDYQNMVALDERRFYYYVIDLTYRRASRLVNLVKLTQQQAKGEIPSIRLVAYVPNKKTLSKLKKQHPELLTHQTFTFLSDSQLNQFLKHPLSFFR